jgi:hypothetical protein
MKTLNLDTELRCLDQDKQENVGDWEKQSMGIICLTGREQAAFL